MLTLLRNCSPPHMGRELVTVNDLFQRSITAALGGKLTDRPACAGVAGGCADRCRVDHRELVLLVASRLGGAVLV